MSTLSLAAQQKSVEGVPSDAANPVVEQSPTPLETISTVFKTDAGDLQYLFGGEFEPVLTPLETPAPVDISQPLMNEIHQAASLTTPNQSTAVSSNSAGNAPAPAASGWTFADTLGQQRQKLSSVFARAKQAVAENTGGINTRESVGHENG